MKHRPLSVPAKASQKPDVILNVLKNIETDQHIELATNVPNMADPQLNAGMVCFDMKGLTAQKTVTALLDKKIIASTTPYAVPFARLAFGIMNTPAEVERTARAVRSLIRKKAKIRSSKATFAPRRDPYISYSCGTYLLLRCSQH